MQLRCAVLRSSTVARPCPQNGRIAIDNTELVMPCAGEDWMRICTAGLCHSALPVSHERPCKILNDGASLLEAWDYRKSNLEPGNHVADVLLGGEHSLLYVEARQIDHAFEVSEPYLDTAVVWCSGGSLTIPPLSNTSLDRLRCGF